MMGTKLSLISKKAREDKNVRFNNLMHLVNESSLCECFGKLKKNRAPGVDKVSLEAYGGNLQENVSNLMTRMKRMSYRPQPVERAYIPKGNGKQRLLGIPTIEDKLVQMAFSRILNAIWEMDFLSFSYGYRPGLGCHHALTRLNEVLMTKSVGLVIDADIEGYFDNVAHDKIVDCLKKRINDKKFLRYIVRMLKSGIVEGRNYYATEKGTPQGGVISPILANVYLHYLLDRWFVGQLYPNCRGNANMIRYCDDFVICVEYEEDVLYILNRLAHRLNAGKLKLSEAKTKVARFRRPNGNSDAKKGDRPETFNFLGLTHYWEKSRKGFYKIGRRTECIRLRKAVGKVKDWLRRNRNVFPLKDVWKCASQMLRGHFGYYGVSGNYRKLSQFRYLVSRLLFKWLNRRSQKKSFNWDQFNLYEKRFPLPRPKIYHRLY
ncbi:MAG: group II intron reverse transcriptase/maturase [bacterium]|nr:group II intron reverse transcriptase/maturase [bacterium]